MWIPQQYGIGNMWVFDATHVPYGVSPALLPADWTLADPLAETRQVLRLARVLVRCGRMAYWRRD